MDNVTSELVVNSAHNGAIAEAPTTNGTATIDKPTRKSPPVPRARKIEDKEKSKIEKKEAKTKPEKNTEKSKIEKPVTTKGKKPTTEAKKPETPPKTGKGKKSEKETPAQRLPGRAKKTGLRDPQIRLLKALTKAKSPLTKKEAAEAANVDPTKTGEYIGPRDGETAKAAARYPFPGLFELGYVKVEKFETGPAVCTITAKGRQAYEKLVKEGRAF